VNPTTNLKACLVLGLLGGTFSTAHADVFAFKDLEGFEKCLRTDHLVETVNTPTGNQKRFLDQTEIQLRCVDAAVTLLAPAKNKDTMLEFVRATKRESDPENSLDLINLLVDTSLPACNEMAVYEVFTRSLSHPKDRFYFVKTKRAVHTCLKDKAFLKDFLEEQASSNTYLSANSCAILLEEKLVKACKVTK